MLIMWGTRSSTTRGPDVVFFCRGCGKQAVGETYERIEETLLYYILPIGRRRTPVLFCTHCGAEWNPGCSLSALIETPPDWLRLVQYTPDGQPQLPAAPPPGSEAPHEVRVVELVAGDQRDENTKAITRPLSTFKAGTRAIYVNAELADLPAGAPILTGLRAVDVVTPGGVQVQDTDMLAASTVASGPWVTSAQYFVRPQRGWPLGSYCANIVVADRLVASLPFTIEKPR